MYRWIIGDLWPSFQTHGEPFLFKPPQMVTQKKKNVSEVTAINEAFIWSMVFDASIIAHFFSIAQVSSYLTGKCPVLRTQEMA